jgi:hypothetical protein
MSVPYVHPEGEESVVVATTPVNAAPLTSSFYQEVSYAFPALDQYDPVQMFGNLTQPQFPEVEGSGFFGGIADWFSNLLNFTPEGRLWHEIPGDWASGIPIFGDALERIWDSLISVPKAAIESHMGEPVPLGDWFTLPKNVTGIPISVLAGLQDVVQDIFGIPDEKTVDLDKWLAFIDQEHEYSQPGLQKAADVISDVTALGVTTAAGGGALSAVTKYGSKFLPWILPTAATYGIYETRKAADDIAESMAEISDYMAGYDWTQAGPGPSMVPEPRPTETPDTSHSEVDGGRQQIEVVWPEDLGSGDLFSIPPAAPSIIYHTIAAPEYDKPVSHGGGGAPFIPRKKKKKKKKKSKDNDRGGATTEPSENKENKERRRGGSTSESPRLVRDRITTAPGSASQSMGGKSVR